MKCAIIAFDGLEYNFVERFDLKYLKQSEYGKIRIPKECYTKVKSKHFKEAHQEPFTPLVWYSFLTGKLPGSIIHSSRRWDNKYLNMIGEMLSKFGLWRIRKGVFLERLGFSTRSFQRMDFPSATIFDLAEKSYDINVPVYSEDWTLELGANPKDFDSFDKFIDFTLKKQLTNFIETRKRALIFLEQNKDWELFMVYFKLLDTFGELSFGNTLNMLKVYSKADRFVKEVNDRVNHSFILVVSDHGIKRLENTKFGEHSDYGFYSTNLRLNLGNPKVTDFYGIIEKIMKK